MAKKNQVNDLLASLYTETIVSCDGFNVLPATAAASEPAPRKRPRAKRVVKPIEMCEEASDDINDYLPQAAPQAAEPAESKEGDKRADQLKKMAEIERQANGCDDFIQHPLCRRLIFTSGIEMFAEAAKCYWLIDIVASVIGTPRECPQAQRESFQLWKLEKTAKGWEVTGRRDTGEKPFYRQFIEYSDFPRDSFEFYVCKNHLEGFTMLLKSEY